MYRAILIAAGLFWLVGGFFLFMCCMGLALGEWVWDPLVVAFICGVVGLVLWLLRDIGMRTERIEEMLTITQMKEERTRLERELARREKERQKAGRSEDK